MKAMKRAHHEFIEMTPEQIEDAEWLTAITLDALQNGVWMEGVEYDAADEIEYRIMQAVMHE